VDKIFGDTEPDYRLLIEQLPDGVCVITDGRLTYVNQRLAEMLNYPADALIGRLFTDVIVADEQALALERYRARIAGENVPAQYDIHLLTAQGSVVYCTLNISVVAGLNGQPVTISSIRDVTRQKAELAELSAAKIELEAIFHHLPDVFYRTNMQGIITMISPICFDIIGYRPEVMIGTPMADYYQTPEDRLRVVQAITDGGGRATRVEAGLKHKNGNIIWISTNSVVRYDAAGKPVCIQGVARDVTERKRMEDQLTALSRTDSLTETYNRRYFLDKCAAVIELMQRYRHPASMMMMDLDHFKQINDTYGHHIGDLALIAFTMACRREIRESDILGRLGGEEFGLMLPETTLQNAQALAERIRTATSAIAIPFGEQTIHITVSIGLVELKNEDVLLDFVMRRADKAMYQAKQRGRNQVVTYLEGA